MTAKVEFGREVKKIMQKDSLSWEEAKKKYKEMSGNKQGNLNDIQV